MELELDKLYPFFQLSKKKTLMTRKKLENRSYFFSNCVVFVFYNVWCYLVKIWGMQILSEFDSFALQKKPFSFVMFFYFHPYHTDRIGIFWHHGNSFLLLPRNSLKSHNMYVCFCTLVWLFPYVALLHPEHIHTWGRLLFTRYFIEL